MSGRFSRGAAGVLCVSIGAFALACRSEEPQPAEVAAEPAAEQKPAVDPKIASAMAAAQAESSEPAGGSAGQTAPPEDGIMDAEAARRELAKGAAASLVLGSEGAAPRLQLGATLAPGAGPVGVLELSYRSGGSVMPTIELELQSKVGAATAVPAELDALATRFTVKEARPAAQQPGRLPENARAEIAKLGGSTIELVSTPRGAGISQRHELAGNNPELQPLVMGAAEVLATLALPYPEVPVGVGAFWMVKSRETINGAEVLAYRMVRVAELGGETAKLSVNTRRYLLSESLPLEGFPPHRVRQFQSEGEATLELAIGRAYPRGAEVTDSFAALVTPNDRPNQALPVQSEIKASSKFAQ